MQKFKGLISAAKDKVLPYLKDKLPTDLQTQGNWLNYVSAPAYMAKSLAGQFKGEAGKSNLIKGIAPGIGLAGGSVGFDKLTNNDVNKSRATGMGIAGLMAPSAFSGVNAARNTGKVFYNLVNKLRRSGVSMEPVNMSDSGSNASLFYRTPAQRLRYASRLTRADYADSARAVGPRRYIKSLFTPEGRRGLKNFLTPSDTVQVLKLTNESAGLPKDALTDAVNLFGKTTFDAGGIVNPNIARLTESGAAARELKNIGFKRYIGESAPTKKIGPELHKALDARYRAVLNKSDPGLLEKAVGGRAFSDLSPAEQLAFLPRTEASAFPLPVNVAGRNVNLGYGQPKLPKAIADYYKLNPSAAGERVSLSASAGWHNLPKEDKLWLRTQNIRNSADYGRLVDMVSTFTKHVKDTAANNPDRFLKADFAIPSVRSIFTRSVNKPFDIKL